MSAALRKYRDRVRRYWYEQGIHRDAPHDQVAELDSVVHAVYNQPGPWQRSHPRRLAAITLLRPTNQPSTGAIFTRSS